MKDRVILHIHSQELPPIKSSGGSNRLIDWLAKEQSKLGYKVYALSPQGNTNEFYEHIKLNKTALNNFTDLLKLIPESVTDIEFHGGLPREFIFNLRDHFPRFLSITHCGAGTGCNSVFVSKTMADSYGKTHYIHNGIPVDEYEFNEDKSKFHLFLAKVKRSKKGVDTAIRIAKETKNSLVIAGGHRLGSPETWFKWHPLITPVGFVNGEEKRFYLKNAKSLWVTIRLEEAFGLTVIEAMMSGTPVIAFNRGAMPELIIDGFNGFLCDTKEDFIKSINLVDNLDKQAIREYAINNFSAKSMAIKHLELLDYSLDNQWK